MSEREREGEPGAAAERRLTRLRMTDGARVPVVGVEGGLADGYLGLASLCEDLRFVGRLLDDLARAPAPDDPTDDHYRLGLWTAAVITYGRCFETGRRQHLALPAVPLRGTPLRVHRWLLDDQRDQYIAHLGNTRAESGIVLGVLRPAGEPPGLDEVTFEAARYLMPVPDVLDVVRRLVKRNENQFGSMRLGAQFRLTEALQARSSDELYNAAETGQTVTLHEASLKRNVRRKKTARR